MSYKAIVGGIIIVGISSFLLVQAQPVMSAFSDPFLSVQLADNPVNGKCLKTDGSENEWGDCGAGGGTGTVTSVDMSVPTGLSISGNPITTSGTLALTLTSGYNIPLTASTTNWNNAYGWGDHASAGYGDVSKVGTPVDNQVAVWTGDGTIEGGTNLTYNGTALRLEKLMQINAPTGNPEFNLQENGTTRSKVYHDVNNNRFTFQNVENSGAESLYFADPATFTSDIYVNDEASIMNLGATHATATYLVAPTSFTLINDVITNVATWIDTKIEALTDVVLQGTWNFSGATVKQHTYSSFTWPGTATTTTATTTVPLGTAYTAESWEGVDCWVSSSSVAVIFNDGSNNMNGFTSTTTVARTTLSTNNTFTAGEKRFVDIGALTDAQLSCTVDKIVNN